jgi:F0F1-type ATP synthase epsilon subunit
MNLQITSAAGNILQIDSFISVTLMTEMGEITILPGHEPLLGAIRPGIMSVSFLSADAKEVQSEYVSGGGVVNISPESCTIVADIIENSDALSDLEYIESQKKEAEELMKTYREENGATVDPKRLIELEYELLKYSAMHRLGQKHHVEHTLGARR